MVLLLLAMNYELVPWMEYGARCARVVVLGVVAMAPVGVEVLVGTVGAWGKGFVASAGALEILGRH